jgi:hypothetical protein
MASPSLPALALLVLVPLVAWRFYARYRRLVGRQRLSRVRPWITLTLFPALVLLLAYVAHSRIEALAWLAGALGAGAILARYGLAKTQFEATPQGFFYTPHAPLGVGLLVLFAGRLVYRVAEVMIAGPAARPGFAGSPLTLAVLGLLAGYYISYAVGLVQWRRAHRRRPQA